MRKYDNWIDDDLILCFLGSSEVCSFEPRKSPNSIKAAIGQINVTQASFGHVYNGLFVITDEILSCHIFG